MSHGSWCKNQDWLVDLESSNWKDALLQTAWAVQRLWVHEKHQTLPKLPLHWVCCWQASLKWQKMSNSWNWNRGWQLATMQRIATLQVPRVLLNSWKVDQKARQITAHHQEFVGRHSNKVIDGRVIQTARRPRPFIAPVILQQLFQWAKLEVFPQLSYPPHSIAHPKEPAEEVFAQKRRRLPPWPTPWGENLANAPRSKAPWPGFGMLWRQVACNHQLLTCISKPKLLVFSTMSVSTRKWNWTVRPHLCKHNMMRYMPILDLSTFNGSFPQTCSKPLVN